MNATKRTTVALLLIVTPLFAGSLALAQETRLLAHWPLQEGTSATTEGLELENRGVRISAEGAVFDGRGARLLAPAVRELELSNTDFSVALWLNADAAGDGDAGDLLSAYDASARRGWLLSLRTHSTTSSRANARQLQFGIDAESEPNFRDEGRPGQALVGFAMCVHDGSLFVATCEPGADQAGRVYRYEGPCRWHDLGRLDGANSVVSLASFDGHLYAATGKYRLAGSSLTESPNVTLGGEIFRLEKDGTWRSCGRLPETEAVNCLAVFRGRLYASSLYKPAGFFRYEGDERWTAQPVPDQKRVEALTVYNDRLYATSYDHGHVYEYDGETWADLGQVGPVEENTQTYSLVQYGGGLCVATWRTGRVYRLQDKQWVDLGRLGEELEVMGLLSHNGQLYGGTLPLGEIYRFDGNTQWKRLSQLDLTPDVKYRRVWTMAEYRGRLFCTTLPSGKIVSLQSGAAVSHDSPLPSGWRHVTAVRAQGRLRLYVDGRLAAESEEFDPRQFDLSGNQRLLIGGGPSNSFHGTLRDVRLYRGALAEEQLRELALQPDAPKN